MAIPKLKDLLKEFTTSATGTGAKRHWGHVSKPTKKAKATQTTKAATKATKQAAYSDADADYETKSDDWSTKGQDFKSKDADYDTKSAGYDTAAVAYDIHIASEPTRYQTISKIFTN